MVNEAAHGTLRQWLGTVFRGYDVYILNWHLLAALVVLAAILGYVLWRYCQRKKQPSTTRVTSVTDFTEVAAPLDESCVRAAYHQDIGAREDQQDSFTYSDPARAREKGLLAVVADGMGGLANGAAVSGTIVRTFDEGFQRAQPPYDGAELLLSLATNANVRVQQLLRGRARSGSTLVAALIQDGRLYFLSVGDSRIYLYRGGALLQLTREHIFREELALRVINRTAQPAALQQDRQAKSLTSYFGEASISVLDRNTEGIKLIAGDRLLLASDGVFGTLSEEQLTELLGQSLHDAADGLGAQIREANRPYQDNNTAVILEYLG